MYQNGKTGLQTYGIFETSKDEQGVSEELQGIPQIHSVYSLPDPNSIINPGKGPFSADIEAWADKPLQSLEP